MHYNVCFQDFLHNFDNLNYYLSCHDKKKLSYGSEYHLKEISYDILIIIITFLNEITYFILYY